MTQDGKNESVLLSEAKVRRLRGAALRKRLWLAVERETDCASKTPNKQLPSAVDSARDDLSLRLYHLEALLHEMHWLLLGQFRSWHENVVEASVTQTEFKVQNESKHKMPEVDQAAERKVKDESMEQTDLKFQIESKQDDEMMVHNES